MKIQLKTISFYNNAKDTIGYSNISIDDILRIIRTGEYGLKEIIGNLRAMTGDEYKVYKREHLPMIVGGGDFIYRNQWGIENYSNILILDFDWEEGQADIETFMNFKHFLISNANHFHLYAVWLSPGHGVKAALIHDNTNPDLHFDLFWSVKGNLFPDDPLDENCSDICRSCFLSYDPDLFINDSDELEPYHFEPIENNRHRKEKVHKPLYKTVGSTRFTHTEEEIRLNNSFQEYCPDKRLMNYLVKSFNARNPNYYKDGYRHKEIKRRAAFYVKDGVLFENAVWSLVGQFGEGTWANLGNEHIRSLVASIYNIAREDFGKERMTYLEKRNMSKISVKKMW